MPTRSDFDRLVRTDAGTPCGDLMRRYWQPVALASELPAGGAPLAVKVLGEELVLFRDDRGRPGLLGRYCAHRGVDLSFGRCDPGGLRCLYHGWLYDVDGRCLEQPAEPAGNTYFQRVRQTAYPCREAADLIFAYLAPGEPPALPELDFFHVPASHRIVTKVLQASNYLQAVEGTFDQAHLSILHRIPPAAAVERAAAFTATNKNHYQLQSEDIAPRIDTERTAFGFREFVTRQAPEGEFLKVEMFVLPNIGVVPGRSGGRDGFLTLIHVPIDDESHWSYYVNFKVSGPIDPATFSEGTFGGELGPDFRLRRNTSNRFRQDRAIMREHPFVTGLGLGFGVHDTWAVESPGPIVDRTREHLSYSDKSIIVLRQTLFEALAQLHDGTLPAPERDASEIFALGELVDAGTDAAAYVATRAAERRAARLAAGARPA
jgi:phthalate 4,5-dioxygenase